MTYTMAGAWSRFDLTRRTLWGLVLSDGRSAEIRLRDGETEYTCSVLDADNLVKWCGTAAALMDAKAACHKQLALEATR